MPLTRSRPPCVLTVLLLAALAGLLVPAAADAQDARARIVGGGSAPVAAMPHQVAVLASDGVAGTLCGGTIRDASHVITAAHCVVDSPVGPPGRRIPVSRLTVRAGSDRYDAGGQAVGVRAVRVAPGYARGGADAAVLTLAAPLTLGPGVQPATVADEAPPSGAAATVSGWGATSSGGTPTTVLRAVGVRLLRRQTCSRAYGVPISGSRLCAGSPRDGEDACQGDSGGPLSVRDPTSPAGWRLVGIVSAGFECGRSRYPGLYTDVSRLGRFLDPTPAERSVAATAQAGAVLAPLARVRSASCGRSVRGGRRCRAALAVRTRGERAGLRVSGRAVPACSAAARAGRGCPATRTLTVRPVGRGSTTWRAARTLPPGRWQLRFSARDGSGARPVTVRRTLRVRR